MFGDGSGAAIVQKDDSNVGGLIASVTGSDGTQGDVLTCKGRGIQNPFHNSKRKKRLYPHGWSGSVSVCRYHGATLCEADFEKKQKRM